MFKLTLASLVAVAAAGSISQTVDHSNVDQEFALRNQFESFVSQYNKVYTDATEHERRYNIFRTNLAKIDNLNSLNGKKGKAFGVNQFSDMSTEEFKATRLGYNPPKPGSTSFQLKQSMPLFNWNRVNATAPTAKDWRDDNAVSPVKDQGQCGSCWAFSATEQVESDFYLSGKTKSVPVLAPQQTVSCDTTDLGCNGGDTPTAYAYIKKAGGLEPESDYPYTSGISGSTGSCKFNAQDIVVGTKLTGFGYVVPACDGSTGGSTDCTSQDEDALKTYVGTTGPASICVNAEAWQTYTDGVISASACGAYDYYSLDHCVQLIGYDTSDSSNPYWLVRNSWGTSWGYDGIIRVEMGTNACGVADEVTYATF